MRNVRGLRRQGAQVFSGGRDWPPTVETGPLRPCIDASALYALAAPDVPESVRQEAVERAEAGERISKREAEDMVRAALAKAEADRAWRPCKRCHLSSRQRRR